MTAQNYSIDDDFITLKYDGEELDLHNNYDFVSFTHDKQNKTAECTFSKGIGDWVPEKAKNNLIIEFSNVSDVFYKSHDNDYPNEYLEHDQNCIDMIGFSYASDEIMNGVTSSKPSNKLSSLLIVFITGKALKIVAESSQVSVH